MDKCIGKFIWDAVKESANIKKHGVNFVIASQVFLDPKREVYVDSKHSNCEGRYFCIGKVGGKVITVRFIYRRELIRIIGAGYWRKGREYYEKED